MTFDPRKDKPIDGKQWHSEAQDTFLQSQHEDLVEKFGPDAVMSVMRMTALFADLVHIDRDNADLIKAGVSRMAVVVNEILPSLNERSESRVYDHRDLDGALGDLIPEEVQNIFVECVATVLLNSKGGPHDSAVNINEKVDALVVLVRGMRSD